MTMECCQLFSMGIYNQRENGSRSDLCSFRISDYGDPKDLAFVSGSDFFCLSAHCEWKKSLYLEALTLWEDHSSSYCWWKTRCPALSRKVSLLVEWWADCINFFRLQTHHASRRLCLPSLCGCLTCDKRWEIYIPAEHKGPIMGFQAVGPSWTCVHMKP